MQRPQILKTKSVLRLLLRLKKRLSANQEALRASVTSLDLTLNAPARLQRSSSRKPQLPFLRKRLSVSLEELKVSAMFQVLTSSAHAKLQKLSSRTMETPLLLLSHKRNQSNAKGKQELVSAPSQALMRNASAHKNPSHSWPTVSAPNILVDLDPLLAL